MEQEVKVYVTLGCPYCRRMMEWLDTNKVKHTRVVFEDVQSKMAFYAANPGVTTVPQLFVDGVRVGGWSDLATHPYKKQIEEGQA
jgi:glutaredoxin 3